MDLCSRTNWATTTFKVHFPSWDQSCCSYLSNRYSTELLGIRRIGPTVKQLWNYAMHVLHKFFGFNRKHNSFSLGPIQPSSPTAKELHGYSILWQSSSWRWAGQRYSTMLMLNLGHYLLLFDSCRWRMMLIRVHFTYKTVFCLFLLPTRERFYDFEIPVSKLWIRIWKTWSSWSGPNRRLKVKLAMALFLYNF